ncbi:MAG: hypothetical protein V1827_04855 [Candidatus Micrarchaeota archaeon]
MTSTCTNFRRMHRLIATNHGSNGASGGNKRRPDRLSRHLLLEGSRTEAPHSIGSPSLGLLKLAGLVLIGRASAQDLADAALKDRTGA